MVKLHPDSFHKWLKSLMLFHSMHLGHESIDMLIVLEQCFTPAIDSQSQSNAEFGSEVADYVLCVLVRRSASSQRFFRPSKGTQRQFLFSLKERAANQGCF